MDHGDNQLPVDDDDENGGGRGTLPPGGDGSADPSSGSVRFSPSS
jgi:hypothetical protein